jgi:hypothetical protein
MTQGTKLKNYLNDTGIISVYTHNIPYTFI